MNKRNNTTIR